MKLAYFAGLTIPQAAELLGHRPEQRRTGIGRTPGLAASANWLVTPGSGLRKFSRFCVVTPLGRLALIIERLQIE